MATLTEALFHGSNKRGFAHSRDYTAAFIVMVLVEGKQHARLAFRRISAKTSSIRRES